MPIGPVTYGYVANDRQAPLLALREVSVEVAEYLSQHAQTLRGAAEVKSPPARFDTPAHRGAFERLQMGTDEEFIVAAQELVHRLTSRMDGRSKRGFFVCFREIRAEGIASEAVVLKLDVIEKAAAAIKHGAGETLTLEAVRDLLELPGDLQKGAVFPDARQQSDVIVGDRLVETAQYFLDSIGAVEVQRPATAAAQLLKAVYREAGATVAVEAAAALRLGGETTPATFFDNHPTLLSDEQQEAVLGGLTSGKRTVESVGPVGMVLNQRIIADGITVTGPLDRMTNQVRVAENGGRWEIVIAVSERPRVSLS